MQSIAPFAVSFKPSRRLLLIQGVAHVVAAAAVISAVLAPWLTVTFLILIGASLAYQRRSGAITGLVLGNEGRLEIVGADGTAIDAVVHPHTVVLSFLVVLLYRRDRRLHSLVLLSDSFGGDDFRQLRLWLRWRSSATNLS